MVFTNVINPRSHVSRKDEYKTTRVKQGASIGANATVVCGVVLGCYCFVGAGAVVTRDVPDYAMVYGNPARVRAWVCNCGGKLEFVAAGGDGHQAQCEACGRRYSQKGQTVTEID